MENEILIELLDELDLKKKLCFNQLSQKDNTVYITRVTHQGSWVNEISELTNMNSILESYQDHFDIKITLDEIIIKPLGVCRKTLQKIPQYSLKC